MATRGRHFTKLLPVPPGYALAKPQSQTIPNCGIQDGIDFVVHFSLIFFPAMRNRAIGVFGDSMFHEVLLLLGVRSIFEYTTHMKINDLEKAPKLFCENIKLGFTKEYFVLALSSGDQATFYSLTPEHAKRLQMYLAHEIAGFEKEHGEIKAEWTPNVVSPLQKLNPPIEGS